MTDAVPQQAKADFFKATLPRFVGGLYVLPTLKFLRFREVLHKFRISIQEDKDPNDRASLFLELVEVVGVKGEEKTYPNLLAEVLAANPEPPVLPWQLPKAGEGDKDKHEDIVLESELTYEGRELAEIVSTLSSTYGWTADYILGVLTYGEVIIYMQEALLQHYTDLNWQYIFSEVGFKKEGDSYVKVPLQQPTWMKSVKPVRRQATVKVPEGYQPTGVVIDYTKVKDGVQYDVPESPEKAASGSPVSDELRAKDTGDSSPG